jgi:hypothetical protein
MVAGGHDGALLVVMKVVCLCVSCVWAGCGGGDAVVQVKGRRVTSITLSTPSRQCLVPVNVNQTTCVWDACTQLCTYVLDVLAMATTCRGRLGIAPLAGTDNRRGYTMVSGSKVPPTHSKPHPTPHSFSHTCVITYVDPMLELGAPTPAPSPCREAAGAPCASCTLLRCGVRGAGLIEQVVSVEYQDPIDAQLDSPASMRLGVATATAVIVTSEGVNAFPTNLNTDLTTLNVVRGACCALLCGPLLCGEGGSRERGRGMCCSCARACALRAVCGVSGGGVWAHLRLPLACPVSKWKSVRGQGGVCECE